MLCKILAKNLATTQKNYKLGKYYHTYSIHTKNNVKHDLQSQFWTFCVCVCTICVIVCEINDAPINFYNPQEQ